MSRVGKLPVIVPEDVKVEVQGVNVKISGPKGQLIKKFIDQVSINLQDDKIFVVPKFQTKFSRAMWGTARSVISNMVKGVKEGFSEELEVNGVGYRASVKSGYLNLVLGKSHNTKIEIPRNIVVDTPKQNVISLSGNDKEKLGQFVAMIIKQRPPEPYKGKGIKRKGQYVQRKEGKKN